MFNKEKSIQQRYYLFHCIVPLFLVKSIGWNYWEWFTVFELFIWEAGRGGDRERQKEEEKKKETEGGKEREREREREKRNLLLLVCSSNIYQRPCLGQAKSRSWALNPVFHVSDRNPAPWAITIAPWISRKLESGARVWYWAWIFWCGTWRC